MSPRGERLACFLGCGGCNHLRSVALSLAYQSLLQLGWHGRDDPVESNRRIWQEQDQKRSHLVGVTFSLYNEMFHLQAGFPSPMNPSGISETLMKVRPGVEISGQSDIGCQRENNEDSFGYWEPEDDEQFLRKGRLAIVADV